MKPKLNLIRKVKWWVIYCPATKTLMRQPFRTKREAEAIQRGSKTYADCVVFDVVGFYPAPRRSGEQA
jgi:hypothetical protein